MNKLIVSLAILTGTTTALLMENNAALAAAFNWSYETGNGDIYTGMIEGEVQADGNTINVTSVLMSQLNGIALPQTPIIRDSEGVLGSTAIVSLNGTTMDLGACGDTDCLSGIFIGDLGLPQANQFSTSVNFGDDFETFNAENWTIAEKPTVPEPSVTLALVGLGLSTLVKSSLKKH
ncbi:MAG: hypothetical protein QNJ42_23615 [Crocosphaera sp.]|nr:hypothetical protein [Crocosphaera sp.]